MARRGGRGSLHWSGVTPWWPPGGCGLKESVAVDIEEHLGPGCGSGARGPGPGPGGPRPRGPGGPGLRQGGPRQGGPGSGPCTRGPGPGAGGPEGPGQGPGPGALGPGGPGRPGLGQGGPGRTSQFLNHEWIIGLAPESLAHSLRPLSIPDSSLVEQLREASSRWPGSSTA